MINNYEIRRENNEDILYIYLDFSDEFAKFKFKEKTEKLENIIRNFIKDNQIDFKDAKVAIVVGGIVITTLLLGQPSISTDNETINDNNIEIIETVENPNIIENVENTEEIEEVESEIVESSNDISETKKETVNVEKEENIVNTNISNQLQNTSQEKKEVIPETPKESVQVEQVQHPNNSVVENNTQVQEKVEDQIEEKVEQSIEEAKTYVTIYRTNGTVITLELEEYIIGVVGAEMPASFHEQALMSQAVIARTYALKTMERNIALTDNSSTQNYKSNEELRSTWGSDYNYYYNKIKSAVESTKGMYLTYKGTLIDAVYHSTSNGTTEDSKSVWGNSFPYLVSVESPYDSTNQSFQAEKFITYEELTTKLQMSITSETAFNILSYTSGNRVESIEINGNTYTGVKIRSLLGLRSTDFEIKKSETGVTFVTKGYGHGVGMSQYGANGMAKNGYSYPQILKHYYQGVVINHL